MTSHRNNVYWYDAESFARLARLDPKKFHNLSLTLQSKQNGQRGAIMGIGSVSADGSIYLERARLTPVLLFSQEAGAQTTREHGGWKFQSIIVSVSVNADQTFWCSGMSTGDDDEY